MKNEPTEITLQTNDKAKVLRFIELEKFDDGSGFGCRLIVNSAGFSCDRPFYFDDSHFKTALTVLQQMDAGHAAEVIIRGEFESDFIKFRRNDLGHVIVSGELFEQSELPQSIKFCYRTDQTVLGELVRGFRMLSNG